MTDQTIQEIIDQHFDADPTGATYLGDVVAVLRAAGAYTPDIDAALSAYRHETFGRATWVWGLVIKASAYHPKRMKFKEPRWRKTPAFDPAGISARTFIESAIGED